MDRIIACAAGFSRPDQGQKQINTWVSRRMLWRDKPDHRILRRLVFPLAKPLKQRRLHTAQRQKSHDLIAAIRRRKPDAQTFQPDLIGKRGDRDDKTGRDAENRSRNPASEPRYRAPQGHKASRGGVLRTPAIPFSEVGLTHRNPPWIFHRLGHFQHGIQPLCWIKTDFISPMPISSSLRKFEPRTLAQGCQRP